MKRFQIVLLLLLAAVCSLSAQQTSVPEKFPVDDQVVIGHLDNGLTYYIRHFENPKDRADFYIANNVGAMQEDDSQDGLAHFLEHMAFNGLKSYPDKTMLNYLAANGVMFGANVNAYTSKFRTVYNMSNVPLLRSDFVDSVLLILHDWSSYILCEQEEIDAERGVIREEWRMRHDSRSRIENAIAQYTYMGTKFAQRTVIGSLDVINNFERQTLLDFYHKWYRPDLQAVIIVGDFDVKDMETRVRKVLSDLPKAENPTPKEVYTVPHIDDLIIGKVTDPEIKYRVEKIFYRQPYSTVEELQTTADAKKQIARRIFVEILRDRFNTAAKEENASFVSCIAVNSSMATQRRIIQLTISAKDKNQIAASLRDALIEMRRVEQHGFAQSEFEHAKTRVIKSLKLNRQEQTVTNEELVGNYINHFTNGIPYTFPIVKQEILAQLSQQITLDDVNAMVAEMITDSEKAIIHTVMQNEPELFLTDEQTREIYNQVQSMDVPAYTNSLPSAEELLTVGELKGSTVKKIKAIPEYDAQLLTLRNGVQVVWRHVDDIEDRSQMQIVANSTLGFAKQNDFDAYRIMIAFARGAGIKDYDGQTTDMILSAKEMKLSRNFGRHSTTISGTSTVDDFESMLKALYLDITEPCFSDKAFDKFMFNYRRKMTEFRSNNDICMDSLNQMYYNNHPWYKPVTIETCDRVNAQMLRQMYDHQMNNASDFVFYVTGSMSFEQVKPFIEKYIGSLPAGKKSKTAKPNCQIINGEQFFSFEDVKGLDVPKTQISVTYHGQMDYSTSNMLAMNYLAHIMRDRYTKQIREAKGGTYSVQVASEPSHLYGGRYDITVSFETDPKLVDELVADVNSAVSDIALNGVTEREMNETRAYMLKRNAEMLAKRPKTTYYWSNKLQTLLNTGVDIRTDDTSLIESVTTEQIRQAAERLTSGNKFTFYYNVK